MFNSLKPNFQSTLYKFFVLGSLSINPFIFWALDPKITLTISAVCGKYLSLSETNVRLWWVRVLTGKNISVPNAKIISSTLNVGETVKLVYILLKLVGDSLEVGVTSLMKRILEACS